MLCINGFEKCSYENRQPCEKSQAAGFYNKLIPYLFFQLNTFKEFSDVFHAEPFFIIAGAVRESILHLTSA